MNRINLVNIRQGTKSVSRFSHGNTLPLVQRPFGMAAFAPQTERHGSWYYHPDDRCLEGIRLTHQPSPWISDYGTFLMTPQNDIIADNPGSAWGGYRPEEAVMTPAYMKVRFLRSMCDFELTPTERGAAVRLHFDTDRPSCLTLFPVLDAQFVIDEAKNEVIGSTTGHQSGEAENFRMYFVLRFKDGDVDWSKCVIRNDNDPKRTCIHIALTGKDIVYSVGTSYISAEMSESAIEREIGGKTFDELLSESTSVWENILGRIDACFDSEKKEKTFYTCLWRTFLFPHKCYEINSDGKKVHYSPADGKTHDGVRYTDNGFWDTYRTVYPLFTLIARDEFAEMLEGFVNDYREGGWLPRWISIGEVGCMPSTLIDAVIATAAADGIGSDNTLRDALAGMINHANNQGPKSCFGRNGVLEYLKYGYVPRDVCRESVNLTLDAAYGDWCIARVAEKLGLSDITAEYDVRSKNYANLFDKETGFMRGRACDGSMADDFDPCRWGGEYTEAAAWQTTFAVQHDFDGLAELFGGSEILLAKLDELFDTPPVYRVHGYGGEIHEMTEMAACDFGQCAISNQPSFHLPFIYAHFGQTEKAEFWAHRMANEAFSYENDGFPGDEDNGTMAAWYIFVCLGMYPLTPGSGEFVKFRGLAESYKINV